MTQATGPLSGVKIIDMSTVVLGPFATMILADLGAEVIKIENGRGDVMRLAGPCPEPGMGPIFTCLNRNKQSVYLDVKTDEGKAALKELLKDAPLRMLQLRFSCLRARVQGTLVCARQIQVASRCGAVCSV